MFVQDIVSSSVNITAEVSEQEAQNFKMMCQQFCMYLSTYSSQRRLIVNPNKNIFDMINRDVMNLHQPWQFELSYRAFEAEIICTLTNFVQHFNPHLKIIPFGSTTYLFESLRIKGKKTNLNLWITPSKMKKIPSL